MEEELNENELEERLYAMLHHVDETQANVTATVENEVAKVVEAAPRSTIRRYWRTSGDHNTSNVYQKVNTPKETAPPLKTSTKDQRPKEEKCDSHNKSLVDLSIFQTSPNIIKSTIEILDHDIHKSVLLETSDEDEVVEVALPPKPTITIESSDEDEIHIVTRPDSPCEEQAKQVQIPSSNGDRESASPVPSVVSSVSDDFIRGDCIALNISSRRPDDHSFDFSLHGSDLLGQKVSKRRRKKKSKETVVTSTPVVASDVSKNNEADECFATPKSKAKHKKQKTKSYLVTEKSVPSADVYDSDSNQSVNNVKSHGNSFIVSMTSLPNADVYESDSNQSEIIKENVHPTNVSKDVDSSDSSVSLDEQVQPLEETLKTSKLSNKNHTNESADIVDLTDNDFITLDTSGIDIDISENIVMANVTGFKESSDYEDKPKSAKDSPNYGSTKIPPILYDNLDFDNLKGNDKMCRRRRYSLTTLRADMQKFYNESWGGEDFNHREIQKHMSKDESLWVIDPKDRMPPVMAKRRVTCNYCNRTGHRDDTCRMKPPVCYMCGAIGHFETRCPTKMCVNCGSPNHIYSTMCRNCSFWDRTYCAECGQKGHPSSHCPDNWRRYHNTVDINTPLDENRHTKKNHQLYCSGCARRGHLVHNCRIAIPFSGLPINSPFVYDYRPLFLPTDADNSKYGNDQRNMRYNRNPQDSVISSPTISNKSDHSKRKSKSPSSNETIIKKKKHSSLSEGSEPNKNSINNRGPGKISQDNVDDSRITNPSESTLEKALDFIPISSTNRDKKGQMIQDNEVSDTSDVITLARIYVTQDTTEKLKLKEGQEWLDKTMKKCNVTVENSDMHLFFTIKGKIADQEAFQTELRDWTTSRNNKDNDTTQERENDNSLLRNIPKNRNNVLRVIAKALESLNDDLGDPTAMYKELVYLQSRHQQLLQQKAISPLQVSNNRDSIKVMLKKLNMVLLGQAGLADGTRHLNELMSIQEKLTNLRQKTITPEMRKEIGQHYHCIFTATERSDYSELLQKYFDSKNSKSIAKKRNRNKLKVNRRVRMNTVKNGNLFCNQTDSTDKSIKELKVSAVNNDKGLLKDSQNIAVRDLIVCHTRLLKSRPNNSDLKKQKVLLVRKLHSHIVSLHRNAKLSTKNMKKVKKTQTQAIMFLNNL
ncbi:zinc finger CCHC-type containing 7 [Aphomia sociella]